MSHKRFYHIFTSRKIWLFWAICGHFGIKIRLENRCFQACGRGIRTSPVTKIKDFEQVPENLVTRLARNNDSSNPYFFAEEENRHLRVPVFLLAEV